MESGPQKKSEIVSKFKIKNFFSQRKNNSKDEAGLEFEIKNLVSKFNTNFLKNKKEGVILKNLLKIHSIRASDIMVPRTDISAISSDVSFNELLEVICESEHTRIVIYNKNSLDYISGFIHIKDLIPLVKRGEDFKIKKLIRSVLFVPHSIKVLDLLAKMQSSRVHIAIVLDEYGGTDGLLTIEDVIEQIIGDIDDEHDDPEDVDYEIKKISDDTIEVHGRVEIEEIEKALNISIPKKYNDEEFDTIGGLVFVVSGKVPEENDRIIFDLDDDQIMEINITKVEDRLVNYMRVKVRGK